jgi:hypothetical protein
VVDALGVVVGGSREVGLGVGVDALGERGVGDWSVGDEDGDWAGDGRGIGRVEVRRAWAEAGTAVKPYWLTGSVIVVG